MRDHHAYTNGEGLDRLRTELAGFSHDGLVALAEDLATPGAVLRNSWKGCPLSYSHGSAGSARRDQEGRYRNAFTHCWDAFTLTDERVLREVHGELDRRRVVPKVDAETAVRLVAVR